MSAELIGILGVGAALAGLILTAALWIGGWLRGRGSASGAARRPDRGCGPVPFPRSSRTSGRLTTTKPKPPPQPRADEIVHPSYQPNRAEFRQDLRIDASFDDAIKALVQPVKVRYVESPEQS